MRKTIASLLAGDVLLTNNNKTAFLKGKLLMAKESSLPGITGQTSFADAREIAEKSITASHYYIKFLPRNEADYSKLKADSNLTIYPFPLDNAQTQYSGNYRDPNVAEGVPTYQYAAVSVGYRLPDVPYQKLEDLYIPDTREAKNSVVLKTANGSSYTISARRLETIADCGNNDQQEACGGGGGGSTNPYDDGYNFRAHGRFTVYDEVLGQIVGVEGLRIRARRWFTTYNGFTDANGYYAVDGTFENAPNYWMDFERYEFSVNEGSGGPKEISGPQIRDAWNVQFDGYDKFCSTIFRAAYHYYYKDIQGLRRPPENGFWNTQMKLGAFNEVNDESNGNTLPLRRYFGIGEMIHVFNPQKPINQIYATTIHELAHAVHWGMPITPSLNNLPNNMVESWARGVQWSLTKMVYPTYYGGGTILPDYTNLIVDLIDDNYTSSNYGFYDNRDLVEGYTIAQIQDALIGASNATEWKNNLKNNYSNATSQNIDALFSAWGF